MFIGIDIGGTTVKIGLFNEAIEIIAQYEIQSKQGITLFDDIITFIKENINLTTIKGIGIGIPGFVLKNGYVHHAVNIDIQEVDVTAYFKTRLNIPIYVLNDANAAAYGEAKRIEREVLNIVVMTLGTGVGGGIILENKLLIGQQGAVGEIGHMIVDDHYKFKCNCGNVGCLETVSSATGFMHLYQHIKKANKDTSEALHDVKSIFEAAIEKDPTCIQVVNEGICYLARAIFNIMAMLNPDTIIIGGGLSKSDNYLLEVLDSHLNKLMIPVFKDTEIRIATLGNDAGIYGLAYYAKDQG